MLVFWQCLIFVEMPVVKGTITVYSSTPSFASFGPILYFMYIYTQTQNTSLCFKSGGQSAGWRCRVSLAQLCQRG